MTKETQVLSGVPHRATRFRQLHAARARTTTPTLTMVALTVVIGAGCPDGPAPTDAGTEFTIEMDKLTSDDGWSVFIPPFEVPKGDEKQDCYFVTVPDYFGDGSPMWIDRTRIGMSPGSHHFNVYRMTKETLLRAEDGVDVDLDGVPSKLVSNGACFDSSNFNEWPLIVNSQESTEEDPYFDWTLPTDVAFPLHPGEVVVFQTHFVNATDQTTPYLGEVKINFFRSSTTTPIELGTLFATQQSIRVCQSDLAPTYNGTCQFPLGGTVNITAINGHFHGRGDTFTVRTWDGVSATTPPDDDIFYEGKYWYDPLMVTGLDITVQEGGGIWWTCEYKWKEPAAGCDVVNEADVDQANDCCYTFGPHVEYQEHCNVFLYYWPKVGDTDVFCN